MKKLLLILLTIILIHPAYALTLEGGVKKIETAEQARQEVFLKPIWVIDPHPYKMYAEKAPEGYRVDYSDGRYSVASGTKMFCYTPNNKLYLISIFDKNVNEYPRKSYRYFYPSGALASTAYSKSEGNAFEFNPDGSLIGVWENGIYYKGDKITLTTKVTHF